jgi:hypothetical protein
MRGMAIGALKGDPRNLAMLFRFAEQTGQFQDAAAIFTEIRRLIVRWKEPGDV